MNRLCFLLTLLVGYLMFGQCNGLPPASAFTINGTASSLGNNEFRLTNDATSQAGSLWFSHYLDLNEDFTLEFQVYLGSSDGGADGTAFVLQQSPSGVSALSKGGGLGYMGITPSLAVEYDTWCNPNYKDPMSDHIALTKNGDVTHQDFGPLGSPSWVINVEDGKYHRTIISWNAATTTMKVFWDSDFIPTITKVVDLKKDIFNGNPYVYWGWTGSTGAAKNLQKVKLIKVDFTEVLWVEGSVAMPTCKNADGSISLSINGGVAPYSYTWSNGGTGSSMGALKPGVYSVEVKDVCGNIGSANFTLVAERGSERLICPGDVLLDNTPGKCATDNVGYAMPQIEGCGATSGWVKQTGGLPSGATFPMGTTVNTFVVMNGDKAGATCKFSVTVQ